MADGILVVSVVAVGLDLVSVGRVARILERHPRRALERLLTESEREYCLSQAFSEQHVAARIAAKEAAYKALSGDRDGRFIGWREVEVVHDRGGRPGLRLHGRARASADRLAVSAALVSITHTASDAAAVVILLGGEHAPSSF